MLPIQFPEKLEKRQKKTGRFKNNLSGKLKIFS